MSPIAIVLLCVGVVWFLVEVVVLIVNIVRRKRAKDALLDNHDNDCN